MYLNKDTLGVYMLANKGILLKNGVDIICLGFISRKAHYVHKTPNNGQITILCSNICLLKMECSI